MAAKQVSEYGSWVSPISSDLLIQKSISLKEIRIDPLDKGYVYWAEGMPEEGGRTVICKLKNGENDFEVITPEGFYVRTLVHEMGGGAFIVYNKKVYFSNFEDQRMYQQDAHKGAVPQPFTPEGKKWRYADCHVALNGKVLLCVREDHDVIEAGADEPQNTVVSIDLNSHEQHVLPWDDTELWIGKLTSSGQSIVAGTKKKVSGGPGISVMLPQWSPDNRLLYLNDKSNWWNLYRLEQDGTETNLCPMDHEFGHPQWVFGCSEFACIPGTQDVLVAHNGNLSILKPDGNLVKVPSDYSLHTYIVTDGESAYLLSGSPTKFVNVMSIELSTGEIKVLRESIQVNVEADYFSIPQEITYKTTNGGVSHGYYYEPKNKDFKGPEGSLPPLLVTVHGGPTSACSPVLKLTTQYYTSRGIAVLDVNYRGSTGYGRKYRNELRKNWGVYDTDDCCQGALYLANEKKVDIDKLAIVGGSAGGYATLCCLTFRDVFKAGGSSYGISDIEALAKETHKFESRYIDNLIGPYPEAKDVYMARSPIHHTDQLNCALALFQGDEDKIVPPNQSEKMFQVVKDKGLPVAYQLYEGEQHGFRKSENIKDCIESELYFFSKVFGFEAPGLTCKLKIYNLK